MRATHKVIDSRGNITGYIVDGVFYTESYIQDNIEYIDNINIASDGKIKEEKMLDDISYKEGVIAKLYSQKAAQNPFKRDIQQQFALWKNDPHHKVLQLEGSRQIGKTTELQKFAYSNYEYTIYINMASDVSDFKDVVKHGAKPLEMEKYCRRAGLPHFVNDKDTVIIIDEIQQSVLVYNAIRSLEENLDCDIIITGSYLGRFLANIRKDKNEDKVFFSAGTIQPLKMDTLSFREFCRVFESEELLLKLDLFGDGSEQDYEKLSQLYEIYRQIGGYPAVIKEYIQSRSIKKCYRVIESLLSVFKDESRNYFTDEVEVELFDEIYDFALNQMCTNHMGSDRDIIKETPAIIENKFKNIVSTKEFRNALMWLKYSGIIGTCNLAADGKITEKTSARKIYFKDCGIAAYLTNNSGIAESLLKGILTETFVFNELERLFTTDYGIRKVKNKLHYGIYGNYELDFMLMDINDTVYGIEVKTSKGDPKSLKVFIEKGLVKRGIVAKMTSGGHSEYFDTIPIYAVGCRFPYC